MKQKHTYSSEQLVQMVQGSPSDRNRAISYLFESNKEKTLAYLQSKGAPPAIADDLLQEGMLILIRQIQAKKFQGKNQAGIHTYFVGICKHLWLNERRRLQKAPLPISEAQIPELGDHPPFSNEQEEHQFLLHRSLQQLGEVCRRILLLRSQTPAVPWAELALEFGFKNAQNAMNKGGKCMKQLRSLFFQPSAHGTH